MTHLQIVGLIGKAGSGKDTAAHYLAEALQARCRSTRLMAFADPIRQALMAMGVPSSYVFERHLKEETVPGWGCSYRKLAQTLGTEWGRDLISSTLWIDRLADRVVNLGAAGRLPDVLVITDVRLQNEADWIAARGGLLVEVVRPQLAQVREHSSEAGVVGRRETLHNDSDLVSLRSRCGQLCDVVMAHAALAAAGVAA